MPQPAKVENKGAELVSIMDHLDTSTATGRMLFGILAVLAEFEDHRAVKVRSGHRSQQR